MLSDPNQVANVADAANVKGNFLPANTKSVVDLTFLEAHKPMAKFSKRYKIIDAASIDADVGMIFGYKQRW